MRNIEALRYKQRLDNLFQQIAAFGGDIELQSNWAKYLCILVSGFIETSIRSIYGEYARQRSNTNVANYVISRLARFTNPNMEDILVLSGSFDSDWRNNLENATTDEQKDSVNSIVANRNRIAHGVDVGISYVTVKRYYDNVVQVIDLVEENCR